jgi:hypothetical protein
MWLRGRQDPDERDHATQIAVRTHVKELPTTPRQAMLGRWRGATLDSRPKETAAARIEGPQKLAQKLFSLPGTTLCWSTGQDFLDGEVSHEACPKKADNRPIVICLIRPWEVNFLTTLGQAALSSDAAAW